jgi:hypothetical protein
MAAAAVAGSQRFSWDATVAATLDLYGDAVRGHRRLDGEPALLPAVAPAGLRAVAPAGLRAVAP